MNQHPSFATLLQSFFTEYLANHKRASPHTVDAYRDTFRLLLTNLRDTRGISPCDIRIGDLDARAILDFLDHLEHARKCTVRSRNARLAAIRAFFRYAALKDPEVVAVATRVLAIPVKRTEHRLVGYLTREEMMAVLAAPNRTQWTGRRDHALLLTFNNTGARLSEMTALKRDEVCLGTTSFVHLHGKGRKEREVPLWANTGRILKTWLQETQNGPGNVVFPSSRGGQLSADGVNYILRIAVKSASAKCPSLATKRITPHLLRHSTAMHLLQSGVDISVIALWLGHESIETTHIYVEADLATKERALEKLAPPGGTHRRFRPSDSLLAFLSAL